jgi:uncharacterized membrane protein
VAAGVRRLGPAAELAAMLAAGTALSWWLTGHVFGHSNNVFHLPIVAGLARQPGFAGDAYVQSLAGFASGLWMWLEGSDAAWPASSLFAFGLAASKALTLLGAVAVARTLGLAGRLRTLAFIGVLVTTPLLQGTAYAGHGGLFVDFFSHSELANGLTLLVWWASLRQRHGLALALNGGVCFLNAFMAAWNVLPWLWLLLADQRARRWHWRAQAGSLAAGLAVAMLCAAPVLWRVGWAALTGDGVEAGGIAGPPGQAALVNLREFVREHYPYHFVASEMPLPQWLGLGAVVVAAAVGLHWLGPAAAGLQRLLMAYGVVYVAGIVLPLLSDAPVLVRLHLLRSSVAFHFLAAIVLALVLVRPAAGHALRRPALAVALLTARPAVLLVALVALAERLVGRRRRETAPPGAGSGTVISLPVATVSWAAVLASCLVVAWHAATLPARQERTRLLAESGRQWATLAKRVGELTPVGGRVLLPLETDSWSPPDAGSGVFEYASGRSVWVDHKRGAAVLWQPALHAPWQARLDQVAALRDWPARLDYAAGQQLAMVVGRCDELPPGWVPEVQAGRLCALRPPVLRARD